MAREIAADAAEVWRAVVVWKVRSTGETMTVHHGVYERQSTAQGYVTSLRNALCRVAPHNGPAPDPRIVWDFVDGWTEHGEISWEARS